MHVSSVAGRLALALSLWLPSALAQEASDPRAELRALKKDFNKAMSAWRQGLAEQMAAGATAGAGTAAVVMQPPTGEFMAKAQRYAQSYAGSDDAVGFLQFIVSYATVEQDAVQAAITALTESHAGSERIARVLPILQDRATRSDAAVIAGDRSVAEVVDQLFADLDPKQRNLGLYLQQQAQVLALCDAVIAQNKDVDALAQAYISRGAIRFKRIANLQQVGNDAEREAAVGDLKKVAEVTDDEDWIAEAEAILFDAQYLQPGCTAPDIEGEDVDGVAFKLSDYRGKVILLDFWGFW